MPAIKDPKVRKVSNEYVRILKKDYDALVRDALAKRALDDDLDTALEEIRQGKAVGPFETIDDAIEYLEDREPKK
ncbi:hypothetical protein HY375_00060 [Candidatus Berkelbacteria bacterium]|nr:hypothetical protein [Candidatus Berkelbacteria bacterium]